LIGFNLLFNAPDESNIIPYDWFKAMVDQEGPALVLTVGGSQSITEQPLHAH
jgi:hypothetical protein